MMRFLSLGLLALTAALPGTSSAQSTDGISTETLVPLTQNAPRALDEEVISFTQVDAAIAPQGGVLRILDKMSGGLTDYRLAPDQRETAGRIEISITECRYPIDNPNGDAFAYVTVRDPFKSLVLFEGWMIASSPALNALDHHRYDVWVLRCITS
ncbi:MAG: DUF2155 domain-containing protein [Paracoccaceae bacterium]|nr:DUF2155 domain-containing protein [Paracoccaceae bacterium]